jgi:2,4-dienoyl-CoA reductase-like NADH-dependent reductase (Old Yellow Enzyme family)/thioredoxin reductase
MKAAYPQLMSPMKIGTHTFKSHLISLCSQPPYLQGPEPYPTDAIISHYIGRARHGVAMMTMFGTKVGTRIPHYCEWDFFDARCQQSISLLTDAVHGFGVKCSMTLSSDFPEGWDVSDGVPSFFIRGDGSAPAPGREMPESMLVQVADNMVRLALALRETGFDGGYIHNSYRVNLGRFLAPATNRRTDKYGGSFENRIRFPLYVFDRIKKECGRDFIIETTVTADEHEEGGWTMDDTVAYAKALEGYADILHIRPHSVDMSSCLGIHGGETPWLPLAEEVKARANTSVKILAIGGFHDLELCERVLAEGRVDLVGTARGFIADPDLGLKAVEGRGEDVVPCIRCNKCHRSGAADPWVSGCSVNPTWCLEHRVNDVVRPPLRKRRVAVIGGGPAGMNAAIVCADRGHEVTLYEWSDRLGGQLPAAATPAFKWPLKKFTDYLVRQTAKRDIDVRLGVNATPDAIEAGDYDAVLVCVGAKPVIPPIPGIDGGEVIQAADVYGHEDELGKRVVIVGGGEIGVETGMHLAARGHEVTVVEMLPRLASDCPPLHYRAPMEEAWLATPGLHFIVNARCTKIGKGTVTWMDPEGAEHELACDSVVLSVGYRARGDEAGAFFGTAPQFEMLGDCACAGNIQKAMRNSFVLASQI